MVIKDGNKYACESCIRGHRVSGCNHTDRELHFIAPKGRPVKQCDHCRGARKSKSHHAKCDCGGKKERGEVKLDDRGCCCTLGDNCICGSKHPSDLRVDTDVTKPFQARPHLLKGTSESNITSFMNGHHKICHKLKHSTHGSGTPYSIPNKGTGASSSPCSIDHSEQASQMSITDSNDDSTMLSPTAGLYTPSMPAQLSVDNLPLMSPFFNSQSIQQYATSTPVEGQSECAFSPNDTCSEQFINELLTTTNNTSPVDEKMSQFQNNSSYPGQDEMLGDHPSFSPADLPLSNNTFAMEFPQPTSFSEESNAHSAPGMTTASSTTHSELGDPNVLMETSLGKPYGTDSIFGFDFENGASFKGIGPSTTPKPIIPPTSDPMDNMRRSLDVDTMRSLSSFPAFDHGLEPYLDSPPIVNPPTRITTNFRESFPSPSRIAVARAIAEPRPFKPSPVMNFNASMTSSNTTDRPRSMPVPISSSSVSAYNTTPYNPTAYNPTTLIDHLYPSLDQDFSAAAAWDPSTLDIGTYSWQYPAQ